MILSNEPSTATVAAVSSAEPMDASLLTHDDLALLPGRGVRSPWLREALAAEGDPVPAPPPRRNLDVDVAIVGGGYTGLWTAYQLTERAPELRIAILE